MVRKRLSQGSLFHFVVISQHHFMQRQTNNNILVPTDFSDVAGNALNHALKVAETYGNEITLLYIMEENIWGNIFSSGQNELIKEAVGNRLEKLVAEVRTAHPKVTVHARIEKGRVYKAIADIANEEKFDSIIMGSHGASGLEQVIGSNASRAIQYAEVPVVVVKGKSIGEGYKKIVMPIDLTLESRQKVEWAIHISKKFDSEVHVVYQSSSDSFTNTRIKANIKNVESTLNQNQVRFVTKEIEDKAFENFATEALTYADQINADLILVMTHTEKGIAEMIIGTLTQQLVNRSENIPVMCIYPREVGFTYNYT